MAAELTQELDLGGTIYISSKRAAEISGYAQDYIGQLARAGHIEAKRISGLWYVLESSLRAHKEKADQYIPVPPRREQPPVDMDASISFDGRDYVSAQRGAKITGYSSDYVGQLARNGKVLSRQVGNRWFVDREELVEHKRHNDSLLAAVQADSVGLAENPVPLESDAERGIHFSYQAAADSPLLPEVGAANQAPEQDSMESDSVEVNQIPIRKIVEEPTPIPESAQNRGHSIIKESASVAHIISPRAAMLGLVLLGLITASGGAFLALYTDAEISQIIGASRSTDNSNTGSNTAISTVQTGEFRQLILALLSKELFYSRSGRDI